MVVASSSSDLREDFVRVLILLLRFFVFVLGLVAGMDVDDAGSSTGAVDERRGRGVAAGGVVWEFRRVLRFLKGSLKSNPGGAAPRGMSFSA